MGMAVRKAKQLRRQQFAECLGVAAIGRGNEAKVYIDDMDLFTELEDECKTLNKRVADIEKLVTALDTIIAKAGPLLDSVLPTPASFRAAATARTRRAYDERQGLRDRAVKNMGFDTFAEPTATPENLTEVMAEDIKRTNREIKVLEDEAAILSDLGSQCMKLIEDHRDLLEPAEQPEEEPKPRLYPDSTPGLAYQFVDDLHVRDDK